MYRPVRHSSDDTGAIAVIVAVMVAVFVAVSVLVVDLGFSYDTRRQLQASAEAAALAGCQELITTGNRDAAEAEARAYAVLNVESGPAGGTVTVEQVDIDTSAGTVRVVVGRDSPALFGAYFGEKSYTVKAAAMAKKWLLTGGRYLLPWAIPLIDQVDEVRVCIVPSGGRWSDANSVALGENGPRDYSGALQSPAATGGYDVLVRVYNQYGVYEQLVDSRGPADLDAPAGRVVVAGSDAVVRAVSVDGDFAASDDPQVITITAVTSPAQPRLRIDVGGAGVKNAGMSSTDGGVTWRYTISSGAISSTDRILEVFPVDVHVDKADGTDAYLHVRRSTNPFGRVEVSPAVAQAGGTVNVHLVLNDFSPTTAVPGQVYTMRVGAQGSQAGNFGELNFSGTHLLHTGSCPPDPTGIKPGNDYFGWTAYGYQGGVHIGDLIDMSPGGSGANTEKALDVRASLVPPGDDVIVCVPVVSKYEDKAAGNYQVIVLTFAAFRLIPAGPGQWCDSNGDVRGEFIQYTANPSTYNPNPGNNQPGVYGARLVNP